jgi:multisubunit Na+/H+ antiporter MnhB subunit
MWTNVETVMAIIGLTALALSGILFYVAYRIRKRHQRFSAYMRRVRTEAGWPPDLTD